MRPYIYINLVQVNWKFPFHQQNRPHTHFPTQIHFMQPEIKLAQSAFNHTDSAIGNAYRWRVRGATTYIFTLFVKSGQFNGHRMQWAPSRTPFWIVCIYIRKSTASTAPDPIVNRARATNISIYRVCRPFICMHLIHSPRFSAHCANPTWRVCVHQNNSICASRLRDIPRTCNHTPHRIHLSTKSTQLCNSADICGHASCDRQIIIYTHISGGERARVDDRKFIAFGP